MPYEFFMEYYDMSKSVALEIIKYRKIAQGFQSRKLAVNLNFSRSIVREVEEFGCEDGDEDCDQEFIHPWRDHK